MCKMFTATVFSGIKIYYIITQVYSNIFVTTE